MGCFREDLYGEVRRHVEVFEECRREAVDAEGANERAEEVASFERRFLNMSNFLHLLKATANADGNAGRQTLLFTSLFAFSQVV